MVDKEKWNSPEINEGEFYKDLDALKQHIDSSAQGYEEDSEIGRDFAELKQTIDNQWLSDSEKRERIQQHLHDLEQKWVILSELTRLEDKISAIENGSSPDQEPTPERVSVSSPSLKEIAAIDDQHEKDRFIAQLADQGRTTSEQEVANQFMHMQSAWGFRASIGKFFSKKI